MGKWSVRTWLCRMAQQTMRRRAQKLDQAALRRPAIVFAPHQDDETLGCGGTILRKKAAGADVTLVFMTDGRQSHGHIIPVEQLTAVRQQEAISAGKMLGIEETQIHFLGFEDGNLKNRHEEAVGAILKILHTCRPEQVFIPYRQEPPADHVATNEIVLAALKACGRNVGVYEYPVWFWHHWPWVSLRKRLVFASRSAVKNTAVATLGLPLFRDFRHAVYIGDLLADKQAVLEQYRSQMTRLIPDPRWQTLHDVANGEFLACFFQEHEMFYQWHLQGREGNLNEIN